MAKSHVKIPSIAQLYLPVVKNRYAAILNGKRIGDEQKHYDVMV